MGGVWLARPNRGRSGWAGGGEGTWEISWLALPLIGVKDDQGQGWPGWGADWGPGWPAGGATGGCGGADWGPIRLVGHCSVYYSNWLFPSF